VIINVSGLNTLPTYWGTDTLIFRPDRWIDEHDELFQPPPGAFVPWASGPRVCPGKKFAQVEFVAVIARLFLKYRVRPKIDVDETREQAEKRILACIEDSVLNITLHMRHPESIKLIWKEGV
jgi:cytochrome P450